MAEKAPNNEIGAKFNALATQTEAELDELIQEIEDKKEETEKIAPQK